MNRHIHFARLHDFRDVGGYQGADGHTVRWGRLYRSDSLGKLQGGDWDRFPTLVIRSVIDLRYHWEIDAKGRVPDAPGLRYHPLSIEHRPYDQAAGPEMETGRFLGDRYTEVAHDGVAELRRALELIAEDDSGPVVVQCASGCCCRWRASPCGRPSSRRGTDDAHTRRCRWSLRGVRGCVAVENHESGPDARVRITPPRVTGDETARCTAGNAAVSPSRLATARSRRWVAYSRSGACRRGCLPPRSRESARRRSAPPARTGWAGRRPYRLVEGGVATGQIRGANSAPPSFWESRASSWGPAVVRTLEAALEFELQHDRPQVSQGIHPRG